MVSQSLFEKARAMFKALIIQCITLLLILERFSAVQVISKQLDSGPCYYEQRNDGRLVKLNGIKVGYSRELNLDGDGKRYPVTTKSLKPTMFEIPNFLSDSECEHIQRLAQQNGLKESVADFDERTFNGEIEDALQEAENDNYVVYLPEIVDHFHEWDKNNDSKITIDEVREICERSNGIFLSNQEIKEMFRRINYTVFEDEKISEDEFNLLPINKLDAYLSFTQYKHPFHRPRYSEHTWLRKQKGKDPVVKKVYDRVIRLTQLPRKLVEESEDIQVVRYDFRGHYHAHYDSSAADKGKDVLCCHQHRDRQKDCQQCRMLTVLFYLNNVEKGGETAFLVADNRTLDVQHLKSLNKMFNLSNRCHSSNLVVPAKKGTAIMWYNHKVDPKSRWLGNLDYYTIHGGCDVLKGVKWIANFWINAPTAKSAHTDSLFK